jgi:hypothetical protein
VIRDLLRSPSGFEGDWVGYLRNQLGHAIVVGALPVLVFGPSAMLVTLPLYVLWEAVQIVRYAAQTWDSLEDLAFVLMGALSPIFPPVIAVWAALAVSGALRRGQPGPSSYE